MTIGEVADTPAKRVTEYKKRRKPYLERTFRPDENEYARAQGWELVRENKASFRYRKLREFDEPARKRVLAPLVRVRLSNP